MSDPTWTVDEGSPVEFPLWNGKAVIAGDPLTVEQEEALVEIIKRAALLPAALDAIKQAADLLAGSESDDPSVGQALAVLDRFKDRHP
jgi:hypothetical protein